MTETQQMNVRVTKLSAEQVLLKLTCTWPKGQEEKCSKEWRGVVEVGEVRRERGPRRNRH